MTRFETTPENGPGSDGAAVETDRAVESDESGAEDFHILLVEDNPGDARLIEEMLADAEELSMRIDPSVANGKPPTMTHEQRLEDGITALESNATDAILLDLHLPDSTGLDTLDAMREAAGETQMPIVVLTGLQNHGVGIEAINRGAQDFLVKDEVTSSLLVRTIHHAIERARQERERIRRQKQLEALNRLNRIGQEITHAVITTEDRSALEERVCGRLVASDAYQFAWIGGVEPGQDNVVPRVAAGDGDGYLEVVEITADESETAAGPTGVAVREDQIQITNDIETDPSYEPWREEALERGFRSSAAIPIVHEDLRYGVLNVYSSSPRAFTGPETAVLARMGDVIGHAIAAIERKDALVTDAVTELEFRLDEFAEPLAVATAGEESRLVRFDRLIRSDEAQLAYGSVTGIPQPEFRDAVSRSDGVEDVRILGGGSEEFGFELVTPIATSLFEAIATYGGRFRSATIEDGEFRFVVELPRGRDTRGLIERITDQRADATYLAQRTRERDASLDPRSVLESELTEKQHTALETAYFAGYFDWPRGSTGEEIAEKLDISPATLNQHLRTAERKFFRSIFETE